MCLWDNIIKKERENYYGEVIAARQERSENMREPALQTPRSVKKAREEPSRL